MKIEPGEVLKCSFCGKTQKQVVKLIAGPGVYICDQCIDLCNQIIQDEVGTRPPAVLDEQVEAAAEAARAAIHRLQVLARRASGGQGGDGDG